jgi:hypothetical protein
MGPVGSGKSSACCIEIFTRSREQAPDENGIRRTRWAIIRNSYPELKSTTIKTWLDWVPEETFGQVQYSSPIVHHLRYQLPDQTTVDAEILFLSVDGEADVKKLLSMELTGAFLNEARELRRSLFDLVQARVGRFPAQRDGGPTWSGVILDTNPADTDSWLYRLFVREKPSEWGFFQQPSGMSPEAENIENLPQGYYERIAQGKTEAWITSYVDGQWAFVTDGRPVHPGFNYATHVADAPLEPMPDTEVIVGLDFGLDQSAVILQREPGTRRLIVTDEIITEGLPASEFAGILKTTLAKGNYPRCEHNIYGDPAGNQRTQTTGATVFDILRSNGIYALPAYANDLPTRIETVNTLLSKLASDGRPALMISPKCETLINALSGGYQYRRVQVSGDERYSDKPDKNRFSHIADALQYALLGAGEGVASVGDEHPDFYRELVYED